MRSNSRRSFGTKSNHSRPPMEKESSFYSTSNDKDIDNNDFKVIVDLSQLKTSQHSSRPHNYSSNISAGSDNIRLLRIPKKARRVVFGAVEFRHYERILSDNPSVTNGASVGIGWRYDSVERYSVEQYEQAKLGQDPLKANDLLMSKDERERLLLSLGYSKTEIIAAVREHNKARNKRKQTTNNLRAAPIEEAAENVKRLLFGRRGSRRSTSKSDQNGKRGSSRGKKSSISQPSAAPLASADHHRGGGEGDFRSVAAIQTMSKSSSHGDEGQLLEEYEDFVRDHTKPIATLREEERAFAQGLDNLRMVQLTPNQSAAMIAKYLEEIGHDTVTASSTGKAFAQYLMDRESSDGGSRFIGDDEDDWSEAFGDDADDAQSVSSRVSKWSDAGDGEPPRRPSTDGRFVSVGVDELANATNSVTPNKSVRLFQKFLEKWDDDKLQSHTTAAGFGDFMKEETFDNDNNWFGDAEDENW